MAYSSIILRYLINLFRQRQLHHLPQHQMMCQHPYSVQPLEHFHLEACKALYAREGKSYASLSIAMMETS